MRRSTCLYLGRGAGGWKALAMVKMRRMRSRDVKRRRRMGLKTRGRVLEVVLLVWWRMGRRCEECRRRKKGYRLACDRALEGKTLEARRTLERRRTLEKKDA